MRGIDTERNEASSALSSNGVRVTKLNAAFPDGSFLVYYFTTRDHIRCDPDGHLLDGKNEAGQLFDSLEMRRHLRASVRAGLLA